ncbi:MAG: helix-turn-helix transcriptional regulator [Streptomyces sp.]|nr:helix-turn-helix transcriptional regulator [Streptomyces sp.]
MLKATTTDIPDQLLRRVLRLVHRHEDGVLWIEGPADAGKSHLLALVAEQAAQAGATVLARSGGTEGGLAADDLRELAEQGPVLVVHDDVHHCDHQTLLTLRTLTARLTGLPLLWVLAARSHLDLPTVTALRRDLPAERTDGFELTALEPDAVRRLVTDLMGARAADADPYLPLLGGLPGAIRHACALLTSSRGSQEVTSAVITRRLDQLTPPARELVLTASVLGDRLGVRQLCRMLERREPALLSPLREVLAAGLMHAEQEHLTFVHPSVRAAVAATLPPPVQLSLRRRSIDLRLADGTPATALAAEMGALAHPGDERAIRVLETAARESAPLAPAAAAAYVRRAMELAPPATPRRSRLAARLVPLLWETGESGEARTLAREVLRTPPDAVTHAHVCLELARMGGPFPVPQADAHLRRALHHPDVPLPVKDQLRSTTLLHRLLAGEAEEAGGALPGALAHARGTHPLNDLTQRTLRSMSACHRQRWSDALRHSEPVPAQAAELDTAYGPMLPEVVLSMVWRAELLGLAGDVRGAEDLVEGGLAEALQRDRRTYAALWRTARARLLLSGGQLREAVRELAAAQEATADLDATAKRDPTAAQDAIAKRDLTVVQDLTTEETPIARQDPATADTPDAAYEAAVLCARARAAFHLGDDREMEVCAARAEVCLASGDQQARRAGAWVSVLTGLYRDEPVTGERLKGAASHLRRGLLHVTCVDAGDVVLLVAAALAAGQREVAAAAVEFAVERARLNPGLPLFSAAATHARGLYVGDAELLMTAARGHGEVRPLLRARALEDAGAGAAASDARPRLEEALSGYVACGAEHDAQRVRARLRALGVRPLPAASAAVPGVEWRGLTRSELGVVQLIAEGATNREAAERLFVSPHTVNTHLRHAFEKLGVRSRVQLARLYAREVDSVGAPVRPPSGPASRSVTLGVPLMRGSALKAHTSCEV